MTFWTVLFDLLLLLALALVFGLIAERLKQSAIVGYLIAGLVAGPATGWVMEGDLLQEIAEVGVALLLFTIGLEFSLPRLRQLGRLAVLGGGLEVVLVGLAGFAAAQGAGVGWGPAIVLAAALPLSSTAVVLRVLQDRTALDSNYGRSALGILLLQDIAVVPMVLIVSAAGAGESGIAALAGLAQKLGLAVLLVAMMWAANRYVVPRALISASAFPNRDLPVLLALCLALGGAWLAHAAGLSAALGAFVAGILLGESPFADQVRADVSPFRAAFVTLFFASIGTLAPIPAAGDLIAIFGFAVLILAGKAGLITGILLLLRQPRRTALATGLCLAQIGEFSFVIAGIGLAEGLMERDLYQMLLSAAVVTLVVTPLFVRLGAALEYSSAPGEPSASDAGRQPNGRVIVVGFGPAGRETVAQLQRQSVPFVVVDRNPQTVAAFRGSLPIEYGDATRREILEHMRPGDASLIVVSVPDPEAAALVMSHVKVLAPSVPVLARGRYSRYAAHLAAAGAAFVVDEESLVGRQLGRHAVRAFRRQNSPASLGLPGPAVPIP